LEARSRAGGINERGKEFEAEVILSYIRKWIPLEGPTSMLREGMADVEAKFFAPGWGFTKEFVEVQESRGLAALGRSEVGLAISRNIRFGVALVSAGANKHSGKPSCKEK
jgi:hypothetical protein